MANYSTQQDLINAKYDITTIGDSVNKDMVIIPRIGIPFKSFPMLSREFDEKIKQIAGSTVIQSVNSLQELENIQNAENRVVYVSGLGNYAKNTETNIWYPIIDKKYWVDLNAGYAVNDRIMVASGGMLKNVLPGNKNDPNVDLTGWVGVDRNIVSFDPADYGAQYGEDVSDAVRTKNKLALQKIFDLIVAGSKIKSVVISGVLEINNLVTITARILTGVFILGYGEQSKIVQCKNNTPVFDCYLEYWHTWFVSGTYFNYKNVQPDTNTGSIFFKLNRHPAVTETKGIFYNSKFENFFTNEFYSFVDGDENVLTWGISVDNVWAANFVKLMRWAGTAGEPRNTFSNLYLTPGTKANGILFDVNASDCHYMNVEVNGADASQVLVRDWGGGQHTVSGYFVLETGSYSKNTVLFDLLNGTLLGDVINVRNLTISEGTTICLMRFLGDGSYCDLKRVVTGRYFGTGNIVIFDGNSRKQISRIGDVKIINPENDAVALTDIGGTESADYIYVDSWADNKRTKSVGDANHVITYDGAPTIVFNSPLSANRTVTFETANLGTSAAKKLFKGKRIKIIKTAQAMDFSIVIILDGVEYIALGPTDVGSVVYEYSRSPIYNNSTSTWSLVEKNLL